MALDAIRCVVMQVVVKQLVVILQAGKNGIRVIYIVVRDRLDMRTMACWRGLKIDETSTKLRKKELLPKNEHKSGELNSENNTHETNLLNE